MMLFHAFTWLLLAKADSALRLPEAQGQALIIPKTEDNALNDLEAMQKYGFQFDRACNYNHTILEGIIASQNNQF